jgi:hypothetical protein
MPSKGCVVFLFFLTAVCFATAQVEVLYVIGPQPEGNQLYSLTTYDVDPHTALPVKVGWPMVIPSNNVDPLTIGNLHVLYVWNYSGVWLYPTNSQGVPVAVAAQHLTFDFEGFGASAFVADSHGQFAYALTAWTDDDGNTHWLFMLFTIDPSTGNLTNTNTSAGRYGPSQWVTWLGGLTSGGTGSKLYMEVISNPPFSPSVAEDYYRVNSQTGQLSKANVLVEIPGNYYDFSAFAFTDVLTGFAENCCGPGFGTLTVTTSAGQNIVCGQSIQEICQADVDGMSFDPTSHNVFLNDYDRNQIFIGHIDFETSQIVATSSWIPACPDNSSSTSLDCSNGDLTFSPDGRLIYSHNTVPWQSGFISIYAFGPSIGDLTAHTSLPVPATTYIATTTLPKSGTIPPFTTP